MQAIVNLCVHLNALFDSASERHEESYRCTVSGDQLDQNACNAIVAIFQCFRELDVPAPLFFVDDQTLDDDELGELSEFLGRRWRVVIGKHELAQKLSLRETEESFLFLSVDGFTTWWAQVDPFVRASEFDPDFQKEVTFFVHGLPEAFGGPSLWVLPLIPGAIPRTVPRRFPEAETIHGLIHVQSERPLTVSPNGFALTWGAIDGQVAAAVVQKSAAVLAACLVQELKCVGGKYVVTIRGTKRLTTLLTAEDDAVSVELVTQLQHAVEWIYEERQETRLGLLMDRLSIDMQVPQSLLDGMHHFLVVALQQARDSYAFVILERKDAYHKEMREIMKDMKSQADLYASKVRDLVGALTRDILGVLVFVGFSFLGKFDPKNLSALLASSELALLLKFLAGYLLLSCVLQIAVHWRDSNLSYAESSRWLNVLQHYTSRTDNQEGFLNPLRKRRRTLVWAMRIAGSIYIVLALLVWNLPQVLQVLLHISTGAGES